MSIDFDRAVDYYDATRALPPEVAERPAESLVREAGLGPRSLVLELGIGTGRIGFGVASRVGRLTGIDLSLRMMQVLQDKLAQTPARIDLVQGNVARVPFPDGTFDAAYAVHVLHLVEGWQGAVEEARRILKPGGFFLVNWHRREPESPNRLLREELRRLVSAYGVSARRPGAQGDEEIKSELEKWNGGVRTAHVGSWTEATTPGEIIDELDRQIYSETWLIPRAVLDAVMPDLRRWAAERFGSLDRPIVSTYEFSWLVAQKG